MSQISEIVDNSGITSDIDKAINDVGRLITKINEANGNIIILKVDLQGADSLLALNTNLVQVTQAVKSLQQVQQDQTATLEKNGEATVKNISTLVDQRQELALVSGQLKELKKSTAESNTISDAAVAKLELLTQNEIDLKIAISGTTSAIKSQIKENQAAAGSMDELSQKLFQMKERYRAMSSEVRANGAGKELAKDIALADAELKLLDKTIGNSQRNVGNYEKGMTVLGLSTEQAATRFASMAFRMIALQVVFLPLIAIITDFAMIIFTLIRGTDAFIEKQNKLNASNKGLADSIESLNDELNKYIDLQIKLGEYDLKNRTGIDLSIEKYKEEAKHLQALGVIKHAIYDSETQILEQQQKARFGEQQELELHANNIKNIEAALNKAKEAAKEGQSDLLEFKQGNRAIGVPMQSELAKQSLAGSGIPLSLQTEIIEKLDNAKKDGLNVMKVLTEEIEKYKGRRIDAEIEVSKKANEIKDADTTFKSKQDKIIDDKERELIKETAQYKEQLRKVGEAGESQSLDKIVADTKAKYGAMVIDVVKNKELYRLSVTGKDNLDYVDKNITAYNELIETLKEVGRVEEINNRTLLRGSQITNQTQFGQSELSAKSGLATGAAAFGSPSYAKMAAALDAETELKKSALKIQHDNQVKFIDENFSLADGWAQKQQDLELLTTKQNESIERDSFKRRLGFAEQYFTAIATKVDAATQSLQTENKTRGLNRLTSILQGRGSIAAQDARIFLNQQDQIKTNARIGLAGIDEKRPALQESYNKAEAATHGPLSEDALTEANKVKAALQKDLDEMNKAQAEYNNQIESADNAVWRKKHEMLNEIKDLSIQLVQEEMSAINTIRNNGFEKEQQQLEIQQRKLETSSQQKIAAINATAGYQIAKDNEVAKVVAQTTAQQNAIQQKQNELALKKAKNDKQAAEAGILLNTFLAIAKVLPMYSDPLTVPFAIAETALITAIGAAQYSAAASTPLPQFEHGGTTKTPLFRAGEAGTELGITPSGKAMLFNQDAVYSAPIGTEIKTASETQKIINHMVYGSWNNPTFVGDTKGNTSQAMTDKRIVERLENLTEATIKTAMMRQPFRPTIIVQNNNPLQRPRK